MDLAEQCGIFERHEDRAVELGTEIDGPFESVVEP